MPKVQPETDVKAQAEAITALHKRVAEVVEELDEIAEETENAPYYTGINLKVLRAGTDVIENSIEEDDE